MKKMNENAFLKEFRDLLAIDSTTGQFREIHNYMVKKIKDLGYECIETRAEFWPVSAERENRL